MYLSRHFMSALRVKPLRIACAIFALLVIVNDLAADAMEGPDAGYSQQSQQSQSNPQAACPIDNGTAMISDLAPALAPAMLEADSVCVLDEQPAIGLPASIDHPPQLA
jgi:hypothetical protein